MNKNDVFTNWSDSLFRFSRFDQRPRVAKKIGAGSGAYHEIFLMQGAETQLDGTSGFGCMKNTMRFGLKQKIKDPQA